MSEMIVRFHHDERGVARSWEEVGKIVRCKDCKYAYMTGDGLVKHCDIWFPEDALYQDGDYFCADGELRGEQDDNRRL